MRIKSLEINGFRNIKKTSLQFQKDYSVFAFVGANGQGKTNLLEALFLLAISKSFRTRENEDLISFDEDHCSLKAEIELTKQGKRIYLIEVKLRNDGDEIYNAFDPSVALTVVYIDPNNPDKGAAAFMGVSPLWPAPMPFPVGKNGGERVLDSYYFVGVSNMPASWGIGDYCNSYPILPGGEYLVVAEISYHGGSSHKFYMATATASLTLAGLKAKMKNLFFSDFTDVSEENSGPLTARIDVTKQGRRSYLIEVKLRNDGDEDYLVFDPTVGLMILYHDPNSPDKVVIAFMELSPLLPLWMFFPVVKNGGETVFFISYFAGITNMPLLSDICNYCDNYPVLPGGEYQIFAEVGYRGSNPFEYFMAPCTASLNLAEPKVKMKNLFFSDFATRFPSLSKLMEKF